MLPHYIIHLQCLDSLYGAQVTRCVTIDELLDQPPKFNETISPATKAEGSDEGGEAGRDWPTAAASVDGDWASADSVEPK